MAEKFTDKIVAGFAPATAEQRQIYYWDKVQPGFGVCVGAPSKTGTVARTFVAIGRVGGKRVRSTIGAVGPEWNVATARARAATIRGDMAKGHDPRPAAAASAAPGRTLRDGMVAHLADMRAERCADRSIATFEAELTKYAGEWLDRPILDLSEGIEALRDSIKANAKPRRNANPANPKGVFVANRVVTHISGCFRSLNRKLRGQLGNWNPAQTVKLEKTAPKRERIADDVLPDWYVRVNTLDGIRRDGLVLALLTGLRSEDVRSIRHEHVNLTARTLLLPDPKGGESAAFSIPLAPMSVEILKRRKRDNANPELFPEIVEAGGDAGYAFPTAANDRTVVPIGDLRRRLHDAADSRFPVEDVHTLRRTFLSVAQEIGITELDQHVLSNHSYGSRNVNQTYIAQSMPHLHKCATKIERALLAKLGVASPSSRRQA